MSGLALEVRVTHLARLLQDLASCQEWESALGNAAHVDVTVRVLSAAFTQSLAYAPELVLRTVLAHALSVQLAPPSVLQQLLSRLYLLALLLSVSTIDLRVGEETADYGGVVLAEGLGPGVVAINQVAGLERRLAAVGADRSHWRVP